MAEPPLHLVIGNYNTSSWSLRAWLVLRLARLAFVETRIPLRMPETPGRIAAVSPSGKLPVLLVENVPIWDSLAIAEFVAELEPGIWPLDPIARAEARAISAELHSGFEQLRRLLPMDVIGRFNPPGRLPQGLAAEIERLKTIWGYCRNRFAPEGPFLFGPFSIADCMMAPVVSRFVTHGVPVDGVVEDYVDSVMAWPDMVTWCDAAAAEQAQREAHGSLGAVSTTRPGRTPGRSASDDPQPTPVAVEPACANAVAVPEADHRRETAAASPPPTLPAAAAPEPAAAVTPAAAAPEPAAVMTPAAGAQQSVPALARHGEPDTQPATAPAAVVDTETGPAPAAADTPAAEAAVAAGPETAPAAAEAPASHRQRLFEASPPPPPEAVSRDAEPADGPDIGAAGEPASAQRQPPSATEPASRAPAEPRLGWIRRPVPAEIIEADDSPGAERGPPPTRRQPADLPRPGSSAVKPIGGGILRRR